MKLFLTVVLASIAVVALNQTDYKEGQMYSGPSKLFLQGKLRTVVSVTLWDPALGCYVNGFRLDPDISHVQELPKK